MTEQMNVPKLRFGEFKSHIAESKKLGQLVDMKSGNTPSKSNPNFWEGAIPWISASSMKGNLFSESEQNVTQLALENGAKLATKGSLLLLVRGSMLFNKIPVGFAGRDVTYNQDVKAINLKNGDDNSYLFHWFKANEYKLLSMVTGTGIGAGKLDSEELLSLLFHQPKPEEQQKIASFLSRVDEKIGLLTEKKDKLTEYKKGVMQQLFNGKWENQNGQMTFIPPTLRFKADDGSEFPDWEEKKLGEVFTRIRRKNKENNQNVLTISARQGLINQEKYFNKSIAAKDVTGYYLLENGDFAYNKSYSKGYPMGAIKRLNNYDKGVVSTLYICFDLNQGFVSDFFEHYFESGLQNRDLSKIAQEGARNHGLLNVSVDEFFKDVKLLTPSHEEQLKIANFLSAIDQKIDLASSELEKAKQWKKGLLQQMFV